MPILKNQTNTPCWSTAARIILCDALKLQNPTEPNTFLTYIKFKPCTNSSSKNKRAPIPKSLNSFWTLVIKSIYKNNLKISLSIIPQKRGAPKHIYIIEENNNNQQLNDVIL